MAGKAIGVSMNFGYPGNYARTPDDVTVSRAIKASTDPVPFGACLKLNSDNTVELAGSGFKAEDFAGIAVREVKTPTSFLAQNYVEYEAGQVCDALVRGAITVVCNVGTPAAGGAVYVRTAENALVPDGVVGGFEAAADDAGLEAGANTYTITTNAANNDEIEFDGVTLKAGTDFSVGANAAATGPLLAAAFAQSAAGETYYFNAVGAAITVTEKVPGGGNTPGDMTVKSGGTAVISAGTETESSPASTVLLPNVKWTTGAIDTNKICEVTVLTRMNP